MKALLALSLALFSPLALAAMTITIQSVLWMVLIIIVLGVVFYLIDSLITKAPFMDDNFKKVAHYLLYVVAVLVLIAVLLQMFGVLDTGVRIG